MEIIANKCIARATYKMLLRCDYHRPLPGQFVEIALPGFYLRRPISICDMEDDVLTLIYKVVGQGTQAMTAYQPGQHLDIIGPFGNGYNLAAMPQEITLIGGGVGVPPLFYLCKELLRCQKNVAVILGFNTREDTFLQQEFEALGVSVKTAIMHGEAEHQGLVTDLFTTCDYVCSCGPEPMLKAVWQRAKDGQYSFEARMGCGFGGCMGCSVETASGMKRICKEGPILTQDEILW